MSALVVVRGEKETAVRAVLEALEQCVGERLRESQTLCIEAAGERLQHRVEQERVVVEVGRKPRGSCLQAGVQPSVAQGVAAQELDQFDRPLAPGRLGHRTRCACEARREQRVPAGQDLVVGARTHTPPAKREQLAPARRDQALAFVRCDSQRPTDPRQRERNDRVPGVALEVRLRIEAVVALDHRPLVIVERRACLLALPDVEAAFLALGVRVQRAVVAVPGRTHLALQPRDDSARNRAEVRTIKAVAAPAYRGRSCALSYSIFSKCGTAHRSSTL